MALRIYFYIDINNPQLPHPGLEDVGVAEGAVELQLVLVNAGRGQGLPIIIIIINNDNNASTSATLPHCLHLTHARWKGVLSTAMKASAGYTERLHAGHWGGVALTRRKLDSKFGQK